MTHVPGHKKKKTVLTKDQRKIKKEGRKEAEKRAVKKIGPLASLGAKKITRKQTRENLSAQEEGRKPRELKRSVGGPPQQGKESQLKATPDRFQGGKPIKTLRGDKAKAFSKEAEERTEINLKRRLENEKENIGRAERGEDLLAFRGLREGETEADLEQPFIQTPEELAELSQLEQETLDLNDEERLEQGLLPLEPEQRDSFLGFQKDEGGGILGGDFATPKNLTKAALLGASIGLTFTGLGAAAKGLQTVSSVSKIGGLLSRTKGLSNLKVLTNARGILTKTKQGVGGLLNNVKIAQNPWGAKRVINGIKKLVTNKKYQKYVTGMVGTTVLNGFLNEEADQTMGFAIRDADEAGDFAYAEELNDIRDASLDENVWNSVKWLIPTQGVFAYLKAARLNSESQRRLREAKIAGTTRTQIRDKQFEQRSNRAVGRSIREEFDR